MFVEQLNPFNKAYYFNGTLRFTGDLNVQAMERALTDILSAMRSSVLPSRPKTASRISRFIRLNR